MNKKEMYEGDSDFGSQEYQLDMENRIRNLLWTISGDYTQDMKPDVSLYLRSKDIALYDGIKQGALARYFDKNFLGLYLVKKVFLQADEHALTVLAQLCIEEAIGEMVCVERPGIRAMQKQAFEDILDQEFEKMPKFEDILGRLRVMVIRDRLEELSQQRQAGNVQVQIESAEVPWGQEESNPSGECFSDEEFDRHLTPSAPQIPPPTIHQRAGRISQYRDMVHLARFSRDTMDLVRIIDNLYNAVVDPTFAVRKGSVEEVLSVTMEQLSDYDWEDFLSEELYEEALESYMEQITNNMTGMEDASLTKEMEEKRKVKHKITLLPPEALEKAHTYVELNFGKSYLTETEEKRMNYLMCREIHADCSLYFTEGILKNPVKRNYQYEYAKRLKTKNLWTYHDKHRIVKRNIALLTDMLKKSLVLRSEVVETLSDRGTIIPSRVWRIGRSREASIFKRELKGDNADFVVDVLIDASGSQMSRQGDVANQAYIISEALSNVEIPHRVMSYCTFWDYTILHRFREYDDPRSANEDIFNYVTSSNNRDGLAIKAVGHGLMQREEEKKILIVLSDGRPYDVIVNRPNAKNPAPYQGSYAISDTATEVRRLRNLGVSVLGVFAGEEKDLSTEKKIFGKDFAYIRDISGFSKIVGRYLTKQLEIDD